jgi:hypothetical protein
VFDVPDVNLWLYHLRPNACVLTSMNGEVRAAAGAIR